MDVTFINTGQLNYLDEPKPASLLVPEWYKQMDSYINKEKKPIGDGTSAGTIKRCMPVFDAITAGYIITTPTDVFVSQKDGEPYYEWASLSSINFHSVEQAPSHPNRNGLDIYPKFINFWGIKTPPGYSCLFVQPMHRPAPFTILPGVVDTDGYINAVNFPFVLNDKAFEGLIPAGTPMAQVIPFKREDWKMKIGTDKDIKDSINVAQKVRTRFFDSYKSMFRTPKEYK
jgi:hypothetical protein